MDAYELWKKRVRKQGRSSATNDHGFELELCLWLLLTDAVDGAHTPHQRFAIYGYNPPIRKQLLQRVDGASVVLMSKYWSEDDGVGNVEIGIACG